MKLSTYNTYIPTIKESLILILILLIAGSLLSALVVAPLMLGSESLKAWSMTFSYIILFIPVWIWIKRRVSHINNDNTTRPPYINRSGVPINSSRFGSLGIIPTFLLLFILVLSFEILVEPLVSWIKVPEYLSDFMDKVSLNPIQGFISVVILAPLLEETLLRGVILRGLLQHTKPYIAIFISAVLFGVIHLSFYQAIPAFVSGILFGWVYWKTGSLWATIFMHALNNGTAFLITLLFPNLPEDSGLIDILPRDTYWIIFVVAVIVTATIIFVLNKTLGNKSVKQRIL